MGAETLLAELAGSGFADPAVLEALGRVPRDRFVPAARRARAWDDAALPIGEGQTLSQPSVVALMTSLARVAPTGNALEVGTGSGYQCAVLAEMLGLGPGREVGALHGALASIEVLPSLATEARTLLRELGYTDVALRLGDGRAGWPERAPFDAIVVTAAASAVPPALREQLAAGGRLVLPVGGSDVQELLVVTRTPERFVTERHGWVRFVPLVGEPDGSS